MKHASVLLLGHNNNLHDFVLIAAGTGEEMMMLGSPPQLYSPRGCSRAQGAGAAHLAQEAAVLVQ